MGSTKYTKTTWVNGSAPAVSAANLNNIENGIEDIQGVGALQSQTTATNNNAYGDLSLANTTYGSYNSALGDQTLVYNVIGSQNVAIGYRTLENSLSDYNTAIGFRSLTSQTTGSQNTALGHQSLYSNLRGSNNASLGYFSGFSLYSGDNNTFIGYRSGSRYNSNSSDNTTIGYYAGGSSSTLTSGVVFVGANAGIYNSGDNNVGVGKNSLSANTTGIYNTALGYSSMTLSTASTASTALGYQSLVNQTTGYRNTAIGFNSLDLLSTYYNCTGVGADTDVTGNNQVQSGDAATTTYAYGAVQNRSDERDKADIRDTVLGLSFVEKLRPVDYRWNYREFYKDEEGKPIENDGSKKRTRFHHGLIAQDVKKLIEETGIDFGGYQDHSIGGGDDVLSIGYAELIAPMIKAIQELSAEVKSLKSQLAGG